MGNFTKKHRDGISNAMKGNTNVLGKHWVWNKSSKEKRILE